MTAADRLAEIQARADAATEGPWKVNGPDEDWAVISSGSDSVLHTYSGHGICEGCECGDGAAHVAIGIEDAEFIAHARTDVPRLVSALQAAIERHRPLRLYEHEDLCQDGTDDHIEERHRSWEYGEYFCLDLPTDYVYCAECRNDDGEQVDYPCPTVCAVEAALGGAS